ncbi:MAG: 2Fe-2S iron-sulfur cluster-binding protein [Acidimicrobiia bacterium]|nr:2Fe-2S iron-sulfur cluster-binding protein [Acidimicrobiia bacterium]
MAEVRSEMQLTVDGRTVEIGDAGDSLLGVLRDQLGVRSVKDGCSPQGQCGCCTVLVDGQPRVACVTPARRVAGRTVTTLDGLDADRRATWASAFCATGASQCGFCTPGIIVRLDALATKLGWTESQPRAGSQLAAPAEPLMEAELRSRPEAETAAVDQALLAHLCRCTGWQTIREAWDLVSRPGPTSGPPRDLAAAAERAAIEGGVPQVVGDEVALGGGGFAADTAPDGALVAVADDQGGWAVGESLAEARAAAGKVQGRRTTAKHSWPLGVPEGDWAATLRTTWVEPGYLETDASWCEPGGSPYSPLANGGAFGGKTASQVTGAARELADRHGRAVLVLASREDATRWGPKRPPVAGGARADGTGHMRVVATPGVAEVIAAVAPGLIVEEIGVPGPPTSAAIRAAGWAEAVALTAGARGDVGTVRAPNGAEATAEIGDGTIGVTVRCGPVLDEIVLRSYCIGAAHMAWSWLTSEALTVDDDGRIADLTIRSFGILRAVDTPAIDVTVEPGGPDRPVNGSDAVFAAVAAAGWLSLDRRRDWPIEAP